LRATAAPPLHTPTHCMPEQFRFLADGGVYDAAQVAKQVVVDQIHKTLETTLSHHHQTPPQTLTCPAATAAAAAAAAAAADGMVAAVATATDAVLQQPFCRPPGPLDWYYLLLERTDWHNVMQNLLTLLLVLCVMCTVWLVLATVLGWCRAGRYSDLKPKNEPIRPEVAAARLRQHMENRARAERLY